MIAVNLEGQVIVAKDFVSAVTLPKTAGYRVTLRTTAERLFTVIVDAQNGDAACNIAESVVRKDCPSERVVGRIFQKR